MFLRTFFKTNFKTTQVNFKKSQLSFIPLKGRCVTGGKRKKEDPYNGSWAQMDPEFKEEMMNLIENLLSPKHLVIKKMNGIPLKCSEFKKYMMNYFTLFASDELPQTQSIYESTVENHMNLLVTSCLQSYKKTVYKNEDLITSVNMIYVVHDISKKEALIDFNEARKMGNSEHEAKHKKVLCEKIEELYQLWSENSEKNIEKLEHEKMKLQIAMTEQQRLEKEQLEAERKAAERLAELEAENARNLKRAFEELQRARIEAEKELQNIERAEQDESKVVLLLTFYNYLTLRHFSDIMVIFISHF